VAKARFNERATVGKAKEKLAEILGVPMEFIFLDLRYKRDSELLKDVAVSPDGVVHGRIESHLNGIESDYDYDDDVCPIRSVTIRTSTGKVVKGRFKETATLGKVKEVIVERLQYNPEEWEFRDLDDDSLYLRDIDLADGCLYLDKKVQDVVKPLELHLADGTVIQSRFRRAATVQKITEILSHSLKIPARSIKLVFCGTTLAGGTLIDDLDIRKGEFLSVRISE
jgi:hypothetical protein